MSDKAKTFGAEKELRGGLMFMPEKLTIIGLDTDHKNEAEHPLYDSRITHPVSEQHVLNAMKFGPDGIVEARKNGTNAKGEAIAEVIDGRQRVRAQRIANERLIAQGLPPWPVPVIFRQMDGLDIMRKVHRSNLHVRDNPMIRARKMKAAMDRGATVDDLMLDFGCAKQTVLDALLLFDGSEKLQKAVQDYVVAASVAKKLITSGKTREQQDEELDKILADGGGGAEIDELRPDAAASEAAAEGDVKPTKRRKKSIGRVASRRLMTTLSAAIEERVNNKTGKIVRDVIAAVMGDTDALFSEYGDLSDVCREIMSKKKKTRKKRAKAA